MFIHHIVTADTVDEIVRARRESKREVQDLLLEVGREISKETQLLPLEQVEGMTRNER